MQASRCNSRGYKLVAATVDGIWGGKRGTVMMMVGEDETILIIKT